MGTTNWPAGREPLKLSCSITKRIAYQNPFPIVNPIAESTVISIGLSQYKMLVGLCSRSTCAGGYIYILIYSKNQSELEVSDLEVSDDSSHAEYGQRPRPVLAIKHDHQVF